jgi:hypothetical protein
VETLVQVSEHNKNILPISHVLDGPNTSQSAQPVL